MDLRELKKGIEKNETFYVPQYNKKVRINSIEKKNGKLWGIGSTEDGKYIRVNIRYIEQTNKRAPNLPKEFPEDKKELLEENEAKAFEALRLLGRNSMFVKNVLAPEMKNAMKKTMMVKFSHLENPRMATVRTMHYANTYWVALKIAEGMFPGDKELQKGIALCALAHDYGQCTYGHDGEEAARKALKNFNAGSISHNVQGALLMYFRSYPELVSAINEEPIIEDEAKKRLKNKDINSKEYFKELKEKKKEIRQNLELRLEPELQQRIDEETQKNGELTDEAVKLLIISAGNHNGERGTAKIEPDYSKTFEDFLDILLETGIDSHANNKLVPHTIADSITKLADQISSIPFDMIDGVRSGIENEISSDWVNPVSQILQITETEARERLNGNNKELVTLAFELQDKLIDSVVRSSNQRKISMDLDKLLYGLNNTVGLRTPNMTEHIQYTSSEEESVLLDNLFANLVDKLLEQILEKNGLFEPNLNAIFRLKASNSTRKGAEADLKIKYNNRHKDKETEVLKDFYNYCVGITAEEYNFNKNIVKKKESEYFRKLIENELNKNCEKIYNLPKIPPRGSMEYAIKIAMMSGIERVPMEKDGTYSDENIKQMISNVNAYLRDTPVDGINNLNVTAQRTTYITSKQKIIEEREVTDDQSIAARFAASYLCQLNDEDLLKLGENLDILSQKDIEILKKPYTKYSLKREGRQEGKEGHLADAAKQASKDYSDANNDMIKDKGEK